MTTIQNATVLVTGGASGIGRNMALRFARRGARVVIWDINPAGLEATVAELKAAGSGDAHAYQCDVTDTGMISERISQVHAEVGDVDVLINNAGVVSGDYLLALTDEQIRRTFEVNTLSLFWMARAVLPSMVERNAGHIVNIASASGFTGVAKLSDYAASKWAVIGFDESLRVELHQIAPGVRTTVVCPYYINTGMFEGVKTRFSWLLPILEEDDVAERVLGAVQRNRSRVVMPPFLKLVPVTRLLPPKLFDVVANFLGVNRSMEDFVGRARSTKRLERT
ncbi:MAG: putative ketoacyl reductase [Acidimicrobiales bacterium]|nr:MAG: SDR family NAD(P)-dependent oxidoreductase [Actinomycetota bacterium]MBV6508623.1 putative ketoacyl reductase [Acidimicrobiales bacterium]RIK08075.1 MAG: short-chain dehydrogenase [Acidobacteriota bacterium]